MKDRSLVLVVSGLPGVGKTTASLFFRRNNFPVVSMGRITQKLLRYYHLASTERNEQYLRDKLRRVHGADVYARRIVKRILQGLKDNFLVIIEGARSPTEIAYLRKILPNIQLLFIESAENLRFKRLEKRKVRPLTGVEIRQRDRDEKSLGIMKLKKIANFHIHNDRTKADFYKKLNSILSKLMPGG